MGKRGGPKTGGRKPGTRNKRSYEALRVLEENDFDPIQAMIDCYRDARFVYENYGTIYQALCQAKEMSGNPFPVEDKADKYLKLAIDSAKDLASYTYPKLKSIEHQRVNPLKDMTPDQKLEAMKQAVKVLEHQAKEKKGDGSSSAR